MLEQVKLRPKSTTRKVLRRGGAYGLVFFSRVVPRCERVRSASGGGDGVCGRSSDRQGPPSAPPPPIDYYQPFFVKVGFTYALNTSRSQLWAQNPIAMSYANFATFPLGVGATIGDLPTIGFEGGVFVTRNVSLDVSFGIPYYVDVKTKGYDPQNPILTKGTVLSQIMPSFVPVTALYHFDNFGAFRPYLGAGLAPSFSFSNKNAFTTGVHVGSAVGPVLQAGFDYMMTPNWGLNADVKKAFFYTQSYAEGLDIPGARAVPGQKLSAHAFPALGVFRRRRLRLRQERHLSDVLTRREIRAARRASLCTSPSGGQDVRPCGPPRRSSAHEYRARGSGVFAFKLRGCRATRRRSPVTWTTPRASCRARSSGPRDIS